MTQQQEEPSVKNTFLLKAQTPDQKQLANQTIQAFYPEASLQELEEIGVLSDEVRQKVLALIKITDGDTEAEQPTDDSLNKISTVNYNANGLNVEDSQSVGDHQLALFSAIEKVLQNAVLTRFAEKYIPILTEIQKQLSYLDFPKTEENSSKSEYIEDANSALKSLLEKMKVLSGSTNFDMDQLGSLLHDINNKLSPLLDLFNPNDGFLFDFPLSTFTNLQHILPLSQFSTFNSLITELKNTVRPLINSNRGRGVSWFELAKSENIAQPTETAPDTADLSCLNEALILIIDDDDSVIRHASNRLSKASASVYAVNSDKALANLLKTKITPSLILLDNRIWEGKSGAELIPQLKEKYPNAIIIVHSSDAAALKEDGNNPYSQAGITDMVGKHQFGEIAEIFKRKISERESAAQSGASEQK